MRTLRVVLVGAVALSGLCGLVGCGTSIDGEIAAGVETGVSVENEFSYAAEPLVPAIRLDDQPAGDSGPVFISAGGGTLPVSMGLGTGILAPDFTADPRAAFHPHGPQVCASGCAASNHATPELERAEFRRLLARYQQGPLDETNAALEALLFYGRQSAAFLRRSSSSSIPNGQHREFLARELNKTHALLSFRIVDEQGIVRVEMKQTRIPLDRRHVFDMKTVDLPPLVTSGTVKRVGLYHLWTRL